MTQVSGVPLTPAQLDIYLNQALHPGCPLYNIGGVLVLRAAIDVETFSRASADCVLAHDALRMQLSLDGGSPRQRLAAPAGALEFVDFSARPDPARDALEWAAARMRAAYELHDGPLHDSALLRIAPEEHWWFSRAHHLVADGWSYALWAREIVERYVALAAGRRVLVPAAGRALLPLLEAETAYPLSPRFSASRRFWREELRDLPPPPLAPRAGGAPPAGPAPSVRSTRLVPQHEYAQLEAFAASLDAGVQHVLIAALCAYVARTSAARELVVGLPSHNRHTRALKAALGSFATVSPLRVRTDTGASFAQLVGEVKGRLLKAARHQRVPLHALHELLREDGQNPARLFDVQFSYQRLDYDTGPGLRSETRFLSNGFEQTPLVFTVCEYGAHQDVQFLVDVNLAYFHESDADAILERLMALLRDAAQQPAGTLASLALLPPQERHKLLLEWNATDAPRDRQALLHTPFEDQARRRPEATAVNCDGARLTYGELDARAERLARVLRGRGVGPESRVAVCLERSLDTVVALLGILKAGGAYVPLDPAYPRAYLRQTLDDCSPVLVLAHAAYLELLEGAGVDVVCLDREWPRGDGAGLALLEPTQDQLAYVIYTSGSTGKPKGVCITHGNALAFVEWALGAYPEELLRNVVAGTSLCFDLSVFELFVPLAAGATVTVVKNPVDARGIARAESPTLLNTVPSAVAELLDLGAVPSSVRVVNLAGERLAGALVERLYAETQVESVYNLYGPSEDTTYSTYVRVAPGGGPSPTIGRAIGNGKAYVLDAALQPQPIGVAGELFLGGAGVARGYLGRPELTAERFVPDPFSDLPGARMYRTGDSARWRPDGELDFLGRLDHQVKLRGFRIELGEIEAQLQASSSVAAAALVVRDSAAGGRQLVAYVVPSSPEAWTAQAAFASDRRHELAARLPDHMVPRVFVLLEALPLTPNGKVDRRALPAPPEEAAPSTGDAAPRDAREAALLALWQELLGREQLGIHDDFFDLGGHSLLALRLIGRVRERLGWELPLRALFDRPTIAGMAASLESLGPRALPPITPVARAGVLPLSHAQERLWFIDRLEGGSAHYNMPAAFRLDGPLDRAALQQALDRLVVRHEALRTRLAERDEVPCQVIDAAAPVPLPVLELDGLAADAREERARALALAEAGRSFDLEREWPLRVRLLRLGQQEHVVLFTLHHSAGDGWSVAVLARELGALYAEACGVAPAELAPLPLQYADYAAWQRRFLSAEALAPEVEYWRERLAGVPVVHNLPLDRPRPSTQRFLGRQVTRSLDAACLARVRAFCRERDVTLFMFLQSVFSVLLGRYSGDTDVLVGTPTAGRTRPELEGLVGLFVNTLVLRSDLSGNPSFEALLAENRRRVLEAYAHQDLPFDVLVEALEPPRSLAHAPLVQVLLTLQAPDAEPWTLPGVRVTPLAASAPLVKFDLELTVTESSDRLELCWGYSSALFEEASIARLADNFAVLLASALEAPGQGVEALPMLAEAEVRQLSAWNRTEVGGRRGTCLHHLFEAQARATPSAIALAFEGQTLTYAELNERANRLAHDLRARGVVPDTRVGLCLERSLDLVVGLLGVMKAGGAYVPLDPAYPPARLAHMLSDSGAKLVLTQSALRPGLPKAPARLVCLDQARTRARLAACSPEDPRSEQVGVSDRHLAYVIYTSGSTGRPKGVCVEHHSLVNLAYNIADLTRTAAPGRQLRWAWNASLSFDASLQAISQLAFGAALQLLPERLRQSPAELARELDHERIDVLDCTPSQLAVLLASGAPQAWPMLLVGGEPLGQALWQRLAASSVQSGLVAVNVYGPTETCVDVTACVVSPDQPGEAIGRWLGNIHGHVLDRQGGLAPVGATGELYIGGAGVARGYLNRPDLTRERFLTDAFSGAPDARVYRTGDLVRWRNDGVLVFVGRTDQQVKLNGFRIELGEVEGRLGSHPDVAEAAVVLHQDESGERRLVACVAPRASAGAVLADDSAHASLVASCQRHLSEALPAYMVPASYVLVPALPLTPSGKLDREALHALAGTRRRAALQVGPRNAVERTLSELWQSVLGGEPVGVHDNFFELGGHSLTAMRVTSRIRRALGLELPVRALFEHPTVAALAELVSGSGATGVRPALVPRPAGSRLPLSYAQQRLWFLHQLEGATGAYNIAGALALRGSLDVAALQAALRGVVARHESLRTVFGEDAGEPLATLVEQDGIDLSPVEVDEPALAAELQAFVAEPFELSRAPLFRVRLFRLGARQHVLAINLHHIVADGWSLRILARELAALYRARLDGSPAALPALPVQYADFALWQRRCVETGDLAGKLDYWKRHLEGAPELLSLPTDQPRGLSRSFSGGEQTLTLPKPLTDELRRFGEAQKSTLFVTLLTAFKVLLARLSGQPDVVVGVPSVNRDDVVLEDLIGLFLDTLPLRSRVDGGQSFEALVAREQEVLLQGRAHGDVPLERIVDAVLPNRDLSRTPLFQAFLNMVNLPPLTLALPGVELEELAVGGQDAKFDLTLYVREQEGELGLRLHYNADLFAAERMAELLEQYALLLEQAVAHPQRAVDEACLLTRRARASLPDPREPLDRSWSGPVHAHFDEQVRRAPGQSAVCDARTRLSYLELQQKSRRLAACLRGQGVGRGDVVAIYAARRAELALALLATFRTGAAFVILDPSYPAPRSIRYLEIARPKAWLQLVAGELDAELAAVVGQVPCRLGLEELLATAADEGHELLPIGEIEVGPGDLAYLAFTSGSTGVPKAVEGCHGSLTHFLPWLQARFGFSPADRFSLLSGLAHDPLHRDVFTPLSLGATLCIPEPESFAPLELYRWMRREGVSVSHLTPSVSRILCDAGPQALLPELRCAFLTGELLTIHDVRQMAALAPHTRIVNFYGSTETQRAVSYHAVLAADVAAADQPLRHKAHMPLGRGIPDVQLVLLNGKGQRAGIGEAAEVFIRSPHLARGYRQDEVLTASRFLANPFTREEGDVLYRTGDLGRYGLDGQVEALGRIDHQVKIRGFRIEPGEIEAQLSRHPQVKACVVVPRESAGAGETTLVAYVVPTGDAVATPALIAACRQRLLDNLPAYMVPGSYVVLESLPLTPNGKVDRRALPAPVESGLERSRYEAPREELEVALCAAWQELLGVERVGIHDDFFELGGHSLLAMRLISLVRQRLGRELPLRALFEQPTVAGLAERVKAGAASTCPTLVPSDRREPLPLSYAQQRLWLIDRLEGRSPQYNMTSAYQLDGVLDRAAFQAALDALVVRHEVLRTRFVEESGEPRQVVDAASPVALSVLDLRSLDESAQAPEVERLALEESRRPFDLSRDAMLRVQLLVLGAGRHVVLFTTHHIASDGWSSGVLIRELAACYTAHQGGASPQLPELPVQYADYAVWQRKSLAADLQGELGYWRERLAGLPPVHALPLDGPRPARQTFAGREQVQMLDAELLQGLRELCRAHDVTLFMLLQTAYAVLLSRYSGQTDVVMGTPVAGRSQAELEGLVGFFVNTLVLRTDLAGNPGFGELLSRSRNAILDAYAHQQMPFELLVDELRPARELSYGALVQVWFDLQNYEHGTLTLPGLTLSPRPAPVRASRFELELHAREQADGLALTWIYNPDLFAAASVERMAANFRTLLQGILRAPDASVAALPLLSEAESRVLRVEWNDTRTPYPGGQCVQRLFEAQAQARPEATALRLEERALSYGELNARANRLAHHLIERGVGPDSLVGLCAERSLELVVGMLAILKAGGAYVPLDPSYPAARLSYLVADSGVSLVLTQGHLAERLPTGGPERLCLDDPGTPALLADCSEGNPSPAGLTSRHLAYVIYTSGSTGHPKGVLTEHEALVNRLDWMQRRYRLDGTDRVLQKTPYSFDVSVWEFLWPLSVGAELVLAKPHEHQDPAALCRRIRQHGITTLHFVPSMLNALLQVEDWAACTSVRRVFCSGEALSRELVAQYYATGTSAALHNLYGPTEAAIDVSDWDCAGWQGVSSIPIGRPIQNVELHVLNEAGELQPIGAPGELHIGGVALARGYHRKPELTREKFVPNGVSSASERLYRTGDLARWRADGTLEYLGRLDQQVKLRGFRIEPGEVECKLLEQPDVADAAVLVRPVAGQPQLVAYLRPSASSREGREADATAWKQELVAGCKLRLGQLLPDFMVPSLFVLMDEWPLTPSGKLDRRALPEPGEGDFQRAPYVAPRSPLEQLLCQLWQATLGVQRVGIHDNFFDLGGNSLLVVRLMNGLAQRLDVQILPRVVFECPSVEQLGRRISEQLSSVERLTSLFNASELEEIEL